MSWFGEVLEIGAKIIGMESKKAAETEAERTAREAAQFEASSPRMQELILKQMQKDAEKNAKIKAAQEAADAKAAERKAAFDNLSGRGTKSTAESAGSADHAADKPTMQHQEHQQAQAKDARAGQGGTEGSGTPHQGASASHTASEAESGGTNARPQPQSGTRAGSSNSRLDALRERAEEKRLQAELHPIKTKAKQLLGVGAIMSAAAVPVAAVGAAWELGPNKVTGYFDLAKGGVEELLGDKKDAKKNFIAGGEHLGAQSMLEMLGINSTLAGILAFFATLVWGDKAAQMIGGIVDKFTGQNQTNSNTPAADTGPIVGHTGPALALDAAGQADIKTLQESMRQNKAVSGYQGAADGQLTPDTIMGMQKTLAHDGKYSGPVDGKLSPGFMDALNNNDNKVGGVILGLGTFSELSNLAQNPSAAAPVAPAPAAPDAPAAAVPTAPAATLSTDRNVAKVEEIQAILRTTDDSSGKPYYTGRISGAFDDQTLQAITAFRNDHPETKADGAALGPATAAALTDAFKKSYSSTDSDIYGPNANVRGAIEDMTNRELNRDAAGQAPAPVTVTPPIKASPAAYTPGDDAPPTLQSAVLTSTPHAQTGLGAAALAAAAGIRNAIVPTASAEELPASLRTHPEAPVTSASTAAQPAPVPPASPSTRLAANDNPLPRSDATPAPVPAPQKSEGLFSKIIDWTGGSIFDSGLNAASAGLAVVGVVPGGNFIASAGQFALGGVRLVGDMAEGKGLKASLAAAGSDELMAGADLVPFGGGLALKAAQIATKGGIMVAGGGLGMVSDAYANRASDGQDATLPTAAPKTPPKVANSNIPLVAAMGYGG
jgi:hypothetical protein